MNTDYDHLLTDDTYLQRLRKAKRQRQLVWINRLINAAITLLIVSGAIKVCQWVAAMF